jgi:regulatory protein
VKKEKKGTSPMDAALSFLSSRARTVREVENKLDSLNYGEYEVYQVVERLKELGYLDDAKYAEDFIESRLATKPVSRRKLREQLFAHFVPPETIAGALSAISDGDEARNALAVAEKYFRQFAHLEDAERCMRTTRRLMGRGFEYAAAKQALVSVLGARGDIDELMAEGAETDADED